MQIDIEYHSIIIGDEAEKSHILYC